MLSDLRKVFGVVTSLAACSGSAPGPENRCLGIREQVVQAGAAVTSNFDTLLGRFGTGDASVATLSSVRGGFDELQRDFSQQSYQLCEDNAAGRLSDADYNRRRECQDRAILALRAVQTAASAADSDASTASAELRAWLDRVVTVIECKSAAPAAAATDAASISLTAYLICQKRQADGTFRNVPNCNAVPLTKGDRAKIAYEVNAPAHVYLFATNATGQFQTLFPEPKQDNRVAPGERRFLPEGNAWLEPDAVAGVTELLKVAASTKPLAELEALRGRDDPPGAVGGWRSSEPVRAFHALASGMSSRGWDIVRPSAPVDLPMGDGGERVSVVPVVSQHSGLAVVELRVMHR